MPFRRWEKRIFKSMRWAWITFRCRDISWAPCTELDRSTFAEDLPSFRSGREDRKSVNGAPEPRTFSALFLWEPPAQHFKNEAQARLKKSASYEITLKKRSSCACPT